MNDLVLLLDAKTIYKQLKTKEIFTESNILNAAFDIFLLYGYHGTSLQQIALRAGVNKALIHYYFRSKDRLYLEVIKKILNLLHHNNIGNSYKLKEFEALKWFLLTEQYNNKSLFEQTLMEIYPIDWTNELKIIRKWLEFEPTPLA